MSNKILKILNVLAFIAMVTVNALANVLPINGKATGEISNLYPNLFTPASFTFLIWGVIYLLLCSFVVYQGIDIFKKSKENKNFIERIGCLFIISCLLNILWIFAWHYEKLLLATIIMVSLLLCLMTIYSRLGIYMKCNSKKERYFVHLPFSIYLAWISIATIANINILLIRLNWNRFGLSEVLWTSILIIIGTIITFLVIKYRHDIFYGFVVIWAFIGILVKLTYMNFHEYKNIIIILGVCIIVILSSILENYKKLFI